MGDCRRACRPTAQQDAHATEAEDQHQPRARFRHRRAVDRGERQIGIIGAEIIGLPVAGQCLFGRLRRGLFAASWLSRLSVTSCSAKRGEAGTNVLMPINRWMDWRWHKPRSFRLDGSHQAYDEALPQSATCRTERESWPDIAKKLALLEAALSFARGCVTMSLITSNTVVWTKR